MADQLRGMVSRRLSLVGLQLQMFWQKTLTSGHSLKQALSPHSSPRSTNFPTTKLNDASSQETLLPIFHYPASDSTEVDRDERSGLRQTHGQENVPATQTHMLCANAATQTELSTPLVGQSTFFTECQLDNDIAYEDVTRSSRDDDPTEDIETELSSHSERPGIFDGESQVVVANLNGKEHLAILVTKEMIDEMNGRLEHISKLERLAGKLHEAKQKVDLININVQYFEESIENAKSQEEIDEYREEIAQHQKTLPQDQSRRDDLQRYADVFKIHRDCAQEACLDMLQKALNGAGLLRTHFPRTQFEPAVEDQIEDDDEANQPEGDHVELTQDDYDSACRSSSEVSINELYQRTINEEVKQKRQEFHEAEDAFEMRQENYAFQVKRFRQRLDDGECSMTQTEFDHMDLEITQELGNDMAAAEDAYEEALERCKKLGFRGSDQESGFLDDEYDGYPLSWENVGVASAPTAFIEDWLQGIPEVEHILNIADLGNVGGDEFGQNVEADVGDWDIRSIQWSDTRSCRDITRNRRRIARWNQITGREK